MNNFPVFGVPSELRKMFQIVDNGFMFVLIVFQILFYEELRVISQLLPLSK